ncbi:MAG: T9SS type A sorting domain-containing protein [Flavobacteriales bacterium]|nr:T9SS type A sorting domain-containing protein [Flavobacteriales bacterium]
MKLSNTLGSLLITSTMLAPAAATGQDQVDVGLYRNGDRLEVRARPASNFNGIFSSLVFTVRWDRSSGANLGTIAQEGAMATGIPVVRSGGVHVDGTFNYQVYAGFGITPLVDLDARMEAGKEVVIASIPVTGKGEFELMNDAWTNQTANNGNYYVSLGGLDRTGIIFKGLASAEEDGSVIIQPNPNNGVFTFQFSNSTPTDVTVEIINTLGQAVFNETVRDFQGTYRKEMDLTSMGSGVYYLKLKRNGETTSYKIAFR